MEADKICRTAYYANSKQFSKKSPRKYPRDVGKLCEHVFDEPAETAKTEKGVMNNMSKETNKPTKVEILRISVKQCMTESDKPLALHLDVKYDTNKTEDIRDMLEEVCEHFGLYCITLKKAEELGLLDEED